MSNLDQIIRNMLQIEGAMGAGIVDNGSGMALAFGGPAPFSMEVVCASVADIVRSFNSASSNAGTSAHVEHIVGTYDNYHYFIKQLDGTNHGLSMLLVLDRNGANQALANHRLRQIAEDIVV